MYDPRLDRLAKVLVRYSLNVRKGDVVRMKIPIPAEPLLLALFKEVLAAGGHPVPRLICEECDELLLTHGKPHQLEWLNPNDLREMQTADCYLAVWAASNTRALSNVDPRRQAMVKKANQPMLKTLLTRAAASKNPLRWVGTQYPCQASAQDAEMSLRDYARFVFEAGMLHLPDPVAAWKKISVAQERLVRFLDKAREIHITTPNGTDIRFGVGGRKWINCDGINNFPDGEVFTGPVEDATEGEVRFNFPAVYGGREVCDVVLRFKEGKVVDASATKGEDYLYQMIDQDRGGRILGELAIGTNYAVQKFTRNTLFDEKIGGTFHVALGAAYPETGGKNVSALHWDMVCDLRKGGVIRVDGKVLSTNGRFVRSDFPRP